MVSGIYKITYNNKLVYIGSSNNIRIRWQQHRYKLRANKHHNYLLQRVFNKYGLDCLQFEIIEKAPVDKLNEREQYYIDTLKPLFNISDASGRHFHSEETKQKMRGRIVSQETREKLSQSHKGVPTGRKGIKTGRVPKTAFKKGNVSWNTGLKLPSSWNKGKHLTEEHKRKLSISHSNKQPTEAQLKYWESLKGKPSPNKGRKYPRNKLKEVICNE